MPLTNNSYCFGVSPALDQARPRSKPTILVAEDSTDSREMMQVLLEMKGYAVLSAADGVSAVDIALRNVPDLVLIDLQLPALDGLSVTRSLRSHHDLNDVPIVIVSGHDPARYRQAALDAGCCDYILKPIDFDKLDRVLNRVFAAKRRPHAI